MKRYWTVIIPSVPIVFRTPWHPDVRCGPFSTLSRGAFETEDAAIRWAQEKLNGTPYSLKLIEGNDADQD